MEFGSPNFFVLVSGFILICFIAAYRLAKEEKAYNAQNANCIHCMKMVSKMATTCPYCNKQPRVKENVRVVEIQNTSCVNCKKSVNSLATICPYCRKNPKRIGFIQ